MTIADTTYRYRHMPDFRHRSVRVLALAWLLLPLAGCGGGGPEGLYLMTRTAFGGLSTEAYRFDDGVVVRNPIAPDEQRPEDVGSYAIDGDQMTLTFGGDPSTAELEPGDDGCFFWDMGNFCPVGAFEDDTLDGTFSGGASVGGGVVASVVTITFAPDGSYTLSTQGSVSTADTSALSGAAERGSYEIDGNLLTLTPEGGTPRSLTTFPYDDGSEGAQPRRIFFGGGMLKRQD
jgi:hypothetical protein